MEKKLELVANLLFDEKTPMFSASFLLLPFVVCLFVQIFCEIKSKINVNLLTKFVKAKINEFKYFCFRLSNDSESEFYNEISKTPLFNLCLTEKSILCMPL